MAKKTDRFGSVWNFLKGISAPAEMRWEENFMRKTKKVLSILLSAAMVLSASGGVLSAFAEEVTADPVAAATEAIAAVLADTTNIAADPTEANQEKYDAKVALYNDAVAAYKAVPEADRDQLDAATTAKFLGNYINREAYLDVKDANPDAEKTPALKVTDRKKIMDGLKADLGAHPERDTAMEFAATYFSAGTAINGVYIARTGSGSSRYKATIESMNATQRGELTDALDTAITTLKGLSQDSYTYLGTIGCTVDNMDYFSTGNPNYMFLKNILRNYADVLVIEDPWDGEIPERPTAPENTARYEDEYRAYMDQMKAYQQKTAEKSAYEATKAREVLATLSDGTLVSDAVNVVLDVYDAFDAYVTSGDLTNAAAATAAYDELNALAATDFQKAVYTQLRSVFDSYTVAYMNTTPTWAYANVSATSFVNYLKDAVNSKAAYDEFVASLNALAIEDVTNETIETIRTQFNALPNAYKQCAPDEVYAKLYDVLAAYTPENPANVPSDDSFEEEIANWEQTEVTYPDYETATPENIQTYIIDSLDDTLLSLLNSLVPAIGEAGGLNAYIQQTVYTNQALATVLNLYHTIVTATADTTIDVGIQLNLGDTIEGVVKPSALSSLLTEEKFAGAKAKIDAASAANGDSSASYADIAFANGDWGFQDGDEAGFINALAAVLRPVVNALTLDGVIIGVQILYMPNTVEVDGNYTYGAYEYLIPVLEGLGLEGIISSEEYSDAFFAAETKGEKLDAAILPILKPIFGLVDRIAAAPLNELLTLLPRLAYLVDSGVLDSSVKAALNTSILSSLASSLDLSADGLNSLIASLIPTLLGEDTAFELAPIDWSALAHAGTAVLADSVSSTNLYRVDVQANKPAAFMLVANYLFDNLIGNETNWNEIRNLLSGIEGIGSYLPMVDSLIAQVRGQGVDGLIISFLPEPEPGVNPDPSTPPAEGGNTNTGNGGATSPDTGDAMLASAAAVFALSGAALIVLHRSRKFSR